MEPKDVMTTYELITALWPILATVIGLAFVALVWFIRLEAKVLYLERDLDKAETAAKEKERVMWEKIDALQNSLNQLLQGIGRVEGKLDAKEH